VIDKPARPIDSGNWSAMLNPLLHRAAREARARDRAPARQGHERAAGGRERSRRRLPSCASSGAHHEAHVPARAASRSHGLIGAPVGAILQPHAMAVVKSGKPAVTHHRVRKSFPHHTLLE
jgi:hypothetical protein